MRARIGGAGAMLLAASLFSCDGGCGPSDTSSPAPPTPAKAQVASDWVLDSGSVSFKATKNGDVEVPGTLSFSEAAVHMDFATPGEATGRATVSLSTVDTGNEDRDSNLRTAFFEAAKESFGTASFELKSFKTEATELLDGQSIQGTLQGQLRFHGRASLMAVKATVTRSGDSLAVTSSSGFVIQVWDWGLEDARKALMKLCGHKDLSESFPVTLELHLKPAES